MRGVLRKIVSIEYYVARSTPHGGGSVWMTLECGHEKGCKRSQKPKYKARCTDCCDEREGKQ